MKPVSLEFCGINSFSEPAFVDFRRLLEFGIFGIFGDTGSGKSTILDCIGFALYGDVARTKGSIAISSTMRGIRHMSGLNLKSSMRGQGILIVSSANSSGKMRRRPSRSMKEREIR